MESIKRSNTLVEPILFNPNSPWCHEPFIYRILYGSTGIEQPLIHEVCAERGWREYVEGQRKLICGNTLGWNLCWRCTTLPFCSSRTLYSWQFTNHIPNAIGFCSKDYMRHFINYMNKEFGAISDFGPTTFILPTEWENLKKEDALRTKRGVSGDDPKMKTFKNLAPCISPGPLGKEGKFIPIWIIKPVGKSQGKGISVIDDIQSLSNVNTTTVVQEYIARPFLIGGYKFDLRLYVCVTSTNPVTVYVYREGLTRFATQKYDLSNLSNQFSHLTNASLNKLSEEYLEDKEQIGIGCKWSLAKLRRYFASIKVSDFYMWQRIWTILVITVVGECNRMTNIPFTRNCFAFLGYDILIDENMRPYLLEVNLAPALNGDSEVDKTVKKPMLHDMFTLLGLPREAPKAASFHNRNAPSKLTDLKQRPVTSQLLPASYLRPDTIERAMSLIPEKNQHKFPLGSRNLQRLIDVTAIYMQDSPENQNSKRKKRASSHKQFKDEASNKKSQTKAKSASVNLPRDWNFPLAKSGDWIRLFPFDEVSQSESRMKLSIDPKLIISRLYTYLQEVRVLVFAQPGKSDEFYQKALKKTAKLNTEIWYPPTSPVVPKPSECSESGACSHAGNGNDESLAANPPLPTPTSS